MGKVKALTRKLREAFIVILKTTAERFRTPPGGQLHFKNKDSPPQFYSAPPQA